METKTNFRNYFEVREDNPWSAPDLFCCAYFDLAQYCLGEKLFERNGISPLIVNRTESPELQFAFIFCRVHKEDVGRFLKAMEELKTQATLMVGDDYAIFCRLFWDELDDQEAMLKIFKPTAEQKRFSIVR